MTDVHNKTTRGYNMSQIKSKDTMPGLLVRRHLFANGYRYRLYYNTTVGFQVHKRI
jgi:DNA mismatch endonuclease (patch repair protein)